jgi:hypothetical protein
VALAVLAAIPIGISLWALLDAARRPQWAWALANRSQVAWIAAVLFGMFFLLPGLVVSLWYLSKVRPLVADAEEGRF